MRHPAINLVGYEQHEAIRSAVLCRCAGRFGRIRKVADIYCKSVTLCIFASEWILQSELMQKEIFDLEFLKVQKDIFNLEEALESYQRCISDWLWYYLGEGHLNTFRTLFIGIWILWRNRNAIVQGSIGWTIEECVLRVRYYAGMFDKRSIIGYSSTHDSDYIAANKWTIFCDGAWCKELGTGGFAAVAVKDNVILACIAGWMINCASVRDAELKGLLAGMEIAQSLHLEDADIVTDSVEALWSWDGGASLARDAGLRCEDVATLLHHRGWALRHIFRDLNKVSDAAAKFALGHRWCWKQLEAIPIQMAAFRQLA